MSPSPSARQHCEMHGGNANCSSCYQRALAKAPATCSTIPMGVCGGQLDAAGICTRALYIDAVRERCRHEALAQLRTGSHWGAGDRPVAGPATQAMALPALQKYH